MKKLPLRILLICSLLFFIDNPCIAQYEYLLHRSYTDKIWDIDTLYNKVGGLDKRTAYQLSDQLSETGRKNNDQSIELEGKLLKTFYYYTKEGISKGATKKIVDSWEAIAKEAHEKKQLDVEARAVRVLAEYYWRYVKNYELGFETYLRLYNLLQKTNSKAFPNATEYYYLVGEPFYIFHEYDRSISFMKKAILDKETKFNWRAIWSAYNTMGLCYQQLGKLDSADYCFKKCAESKFLDTTCVQYSILMGNVGYNYYLKKQYDTAIPLLLFDARTAVMYGDYALASGSAIALADIYTKQEKYTEAKQWIENAYNYIKHADVEERLTKLFPIISEYHKQNNDLLTALNYKDSTIEVLNIVEKKINSTMLLRAQQHNERQKVIAERTKLLLQQQLTSTQRNLLAVIILLLSVGAFVFYNYQKKINLEKHKQKDLALKTAGRELNVAKDQLNNFAKSITEKNKLIEQLQYANIDENEDIILQLQSSAILTEDQWVEFKGLFDKAYPGFLYRLKSKYPQLTPAETRMIVLSRLGLDNKQMASSLGVSTQAMRTTWHRMRKKLELSEEETISSIAENV